MNEIGNMGTESDIMVILVAILAVAQLAARIAQKIPGKKGDDITSKLELYARQALDFFAGRHGTPGDSGAIKPD